MMTTASATLAEPKTELLSEAERQPCEIWTRVMGYFRPVSSFNRGKQSEFHDRKYFLEPERD